MLAELSEKIMAVLNATSCCLYVARIVCKPTS